MRQIAKDWLDYECIDAGDSEKLERWGNVVLRRPDPQAAWAKDNTEKLFWQMFWRRNYTFNNKQGLLKIIWK